MERIRKWFLYGAHWVAHNEESDAYTAKDAGQPVKLSASC